MSNANAVAAVENFWREVWQPPQNPDAIDHLVALPVESTSSRAQDSRNGSSTSNPRSPTWNSIFLRLFRTPKGLASPRTGNSEAKIMGS
jgi:hypothetical protein